MNVVDDPESASSAEKNEKSTAFSCSICGKEFSNEKRYFGHLRIHSGEALWPCHKCPQSDVAFDSQSRLKTHENLFHTLVRPHKCSKCDNIFDRASQLDYHKRSVHLGEKSQICQICGKGFFRKTDLRTHLNVHLGVNQSICEICGRKFNHVSNLIRHCRTHAGSKPYPCTICGKRFTQISSLARHKRIHARESGARLDEKREEEVSASQDSPKVEQKKIAKRQHYCRICGESFRFMVLLRQHERLHSKHAGNCGSKSCQKNPERECSSNKHNSEEIEQRNEMLSSIEDPGQSSASDWRDFHAGEERALAENVEEPTEEESIDSLRDHLLELDRKMSAIEIESDRDVSISISDILSPYNCDEIELPNADGLESKLYDVSSAVNKHNALEKEYDIVQCLNGVDFTSNIELLEASSERTADKSSGSRPKSQPKDLKSSNSKPLASLMRDQYKKRLHVESSHMFIEFCETEYLESSNLHTLELQEIENVALFQEVLEPPEDDEEKCSRANVQKIVAVKSSTSNEIIDEGVDSTEVSLEAGEPRLRLVQTETGEQFYELLIDNQCTDENLGVTEEVENAAISQVDVENGSALPTSGDGSQRDEAERQLEDPEKHSNEPSCNEFFQLQPNAQYREIHATSQHETSMPMVRLVTNEDGEQFFELIREPLEDERNREERPAENSLDEEILEIPSNSDNPSLPNNAKSQATLTSSSGAKRDKKECTTENPRAAKDRTRKFHCTECDKWFSTAYNFKQHAGTHFSDQQKFQCKDCGVSFAWKSTLNKHLAGNHRADGPQKFVCKICPKVYSTLSQVNEHVKRDHLKERNHVCPHCGKSFFKKFDLKTHSRTHTDERPYVCRACGKRFHHQSHIIRHERIHSGERPYTCDICQRSFRQPSALKSHRQRHRDVKIDILEYRMDEDDPLSLAVQ